MAEDSNSLETQLTGHEYDGIQEYDNPTPGWWTMIFAATCVYALGYFIFFHLGNQGWTVHEAYEADVAANFAQQYASMGELTPDRDTLLSLMADDGMLTVGKSIFKGNCVSCHGANGEGLIGPNLTDNRWKEVTKIEDIAATVTNGVVQKGMPAWGRLLHENDIVLVAAYVASLHNTNVAGKAPEGEPVDDWQ